MARRNFFDRAREFVSGAVRQVSDTIGGLFGRETENRQVQDDPVKGVDPSEAGQNQQIPDVSIVEVLIDSDEVEDTEEILPEDFSDDEGTPDEEFESEFEFREEPFSAFRSSDLRRILATFQDALEYARQIPVPASGKIIVRDPSNGLFRVVVEYES